MPKQKSELPKKLEDELKKEVKRLKITEDEMKRAEEQMKAQPDAMKRLSRRIAYFQQRSKRRVK